jgi:hypothetical protein
MSGLLMETGALYVKEKLHRKKYFASLLKELEEVPESVIDLLRLSRGAQEMFESTRKPAHSATHLTLLATSLGGVLALGGKRRSGKLCVWVGRTDANSQIDKFHFVPALQYVDEIVSDDKFLHRLYPVAEKTGYVKAKLIKFEEFVKRF